MSEYVFYKITADHLKVQYIIQFQGKIYYFEDESVNEIPLTLRYRFIDIIKQCWPSDIKRFTIRIIPESDKGLEYISISHIGNVFCKLLNKKVIDEIKDDLAMMTQDKYRIF